MTNYFHFEGQWKLIQIDSPGVNFICPYGSYDHEAFSRKWDLDATFMKSIRLRGDCNLYEWTVEFPVATVAMEMGLRGETV
jgi:hypothetical protein